MSRNYSARTVESIIYNILEEQERGEEPEITFEVEHGLDCNGIRIEAFGDFYLRDRDGYPDDYVEKCSKFNCDEESTRLEIRIGNSGPSQLCRGHLENWIEQIIETPECDECAAWLDKCGAEK